MTPHPSPSKLRDASLQAILLTVLLCASLRPLLAADGDPQAPIPAAAPAKSKRASTMTPEERAKLFEEWRAKNPEAAARMDRVRNMTPEQRKAALQEWREKNPEAAQRMDAQAAAATNAGRRTPEAQQERLAKMDAKLRERVAELEKKKAASGLTPQEEKELEQWQTVLRNRAAAKPPTPPTAAPAAPPAPAAPAAAGADKK